MQLNGLAVSDFTTTKEAVQVIEELVADNQKEYGHNEPKTEHASNPLLNRYFYVHSDGRKRSWSQVTTKTMQMEGEVKNKKALCEAADKYKELFGAEGAGGSSSDGLVPVKKENPQKDVLTVEVDVLRSARPPR